MTETIKTRWQWLRASRFGKTIFVLLVIGLPLAAWAFVIEPNRLTISEHTLPIPALPPGLRIAVFSDLHAGAPHIGLDKVRRVVTATNDTKPDLILLLGDYVIQGVMGGSFIAPAAIAAELKALHAPLGVYAVLGNHDHWYDARQVETALTSVGIHVLENKAALLQFNRQPFWVLGISDEWNAKADPKQTMAQVTDPSPVLAITHNPDTFARFDDRVSLFLAGHTHGGQCAFPMLGRPIVPSAFGERFATGHIVEQDRHLFVTNGIGTSILPVRFGVPPEISVLTISAPTR